MSFNLNDLLTRTLLSKTTSASCAITPSVACPHSPTRTTWNPSVAPRQVVASAAGVSAAMAAPITMPCRLPQAHQLPQAAWWLVNNNSGVERLLAPSDVVEGQVSNNSNMGFNNYLFPTSSTVLLLSGTTINRSIRISLNQRHLWPQNQTSYLCLSLGANRAFDDSFPLAWKTSVLILLLLLLLLG